MKANYEMNIKSYFEREDIGCSDQEAALFSKLLDAFMAYNAHTNLSAIRDEEGVVEKHFVDSAELVRFEKLYGKLLDIGTGGGFPGIPLKILHPELDVTLLDSVGKKIKACETFIGELGLKDIRGIHARAEELAKKPEFRKGFDFVVSRATAYLPSILEWAEPFLRERGLLILYKSPSPEELVDGEKALRKFHLRLLRSHTYHLAGQERKIFVYWRD